MSDRELLELAAKAAGIECGADRLDCGLSLTLPDGRHRSLPRWNPLKDDGDALRLAVSLNLLNKHGFADCMAEENSACDGDYHRATRRAIVRAAAAMAKEENNAQ